MSSTVGKIFLMFKQNYGGLWSSRFADDEEVKVGLKFWANKLSPFSEEEIFKTLDRVLTTFPVHPPSVALFLEVAKTVRKDMTLIRSEKIQMIPERGTKRTASKSLEKIRTLLASETPELDADEPKLELRCFDEGEVKDRLEWLVRVPEGLAWQLPLGDRFDRSRELMQRYSQKWLRNKQKEVKTDEKSRSYVSKSSGEYRSQ